MNNLQDAQAHECKPAELQGEAVRIVSKANDRLPHRVRSELRWLDVTVRTINSRDNLELTHWKKVLRSVAQD
jgi:hypothetical protein